MSGNKRDKLFLEFVNACAVPRKSAGNRARADTERKLFRRERVPLPTVFRAVEERLHSCLPAERGRFRNKRSADRISVEQTGVLGLGCGATALGSAPAVLRIVRRMAARGETGKAFHYARQYCPRYQNDSDGHQQFKDGAQHGGEGLLLN
jgi:hypothetical protein